MLEWAIFGIALLTSVVTHAGHIETGIRSLSLAVLHLPTYLVEPVCRLNPVAIASSEFVDHDIASAGAIARFGIPTHDEMFYR